MLALYLYMRVRVRSGVITLPNVAGVKIVTLSTIVC